MNKVLVCLLLVVLAFPAAAQPLGERVGPQFPFLSTNARSGALGDASGSLLGSFAGVEVNPATLAFLSASSIDYSFNRISESVSLQHLGGAFMGGAGLGFSAGVDMLHFGDFNFYSDGKLRDLGFEIAGRIGFGMMVGEDLSAGLALQLYNATTDTNAVWGVAGDLGFSYAPAQYYRFGLALRGVGSDYEIGNHVLAPDKEDPKIPRRVVLGVVFEYPIGLRGGKFLAAFENEKILGERGILYKLGVEYSPATAIAFRVGSKVRGDEIEPSAGLGLGVAGISLDYAYRYSRRDERPSHLITLGVSWR
ncbi:MAG: hypothetical protein ACKVRP_03425 [Bacteroidota bacterium]